MYGHSVGNCWRTTVAISRLHTPIQLLSGALSQKEISAYHHTTRWLFGTIVITFDKMTYKMHFTHFDYRMCLSDRATHSHFRRSTIYCTAASSFREISIFIRRKNSIVFRWLAQSINGFPGRIWYEALIDASIRFVWTMEEKPQRTSSSLYLLKN